MPSYWNGKPLFGAAKPNGTDWTKIEAYLPPKEQAKENPNAG